MLVALLTVVALGCLILATAAIVRAHARVAAALTRVKEVERRESDLLEAVRVLTAASRNSAGAVLEALDRAMRLFEPSLDAIMVFVPEGDRLSCAFAAGARTEHFTALQIARGDARTLPARADALGHRVTLEAQTLPVIPTDSAAIAVPMLGPHGTTAVVYASSASVLWLHEPEGLVRAVAQAAAPFALALEREADRASATYDSLTGLLVPRAFRTQLQQEIARTSAAGSATLSLWFIDTDGFKQINDTFGHAAGDRVLHGMAQLLRSAMVPQLDLPARNGGDEFCAVLRTVGKSTAIERAQLFCEAVRAHDFGVDGKITVSVGVASSPFDATGANELLEIADAAMYHSKREGRDRVSFATGEGTFAVFDRPRPSRQREEHGAEAS